MTKILAIDTSGEACSVALLGDGIEQVDIVNSQRDHTQRLLPMIDMMLSSTDVSLAQIDAIAFGRGPGSFTGLRIAAGIVQGLAFAARLPVVPVSSLAALAHSWYREHGQDYRIATAFDARMGEVYFACYDVTATACKLFSGEIVSAPEKVTVCSNQPMIGVGTGWHYENLLAQANVVAKDRARLVCALDIAILAQRELAEDHTVLPHEAVPTYLRNEVSWKKLVDQ